MYKVLITSLSVIVKYVKFTDKQNKNKLISMAHKQVLNKVLLYKS